MAKSKNNEINLCACQIMNKSLLSIYGAKKQQHFNMSSDCCCSGALPYYGANNYNNIIKSAHHQHERVDDGCKKLEKSHFKCQLSVSILPKFIFVVLILLISGSSLDYVDAQVSSINIYDKHTSRAINEFSSHTIIKPKIHHGKHKREIRNTLEEEDGSHVNHITLSYEHFGRNVVIDLHLNEDLIPQGHFLRYQGEDGGSIVKHLNKTEVDLCHYQGFIRDNLESRVAVSTCNGINGIIFDGAETYHIHSGSDGNIYDDHLLFRQSNYLHNSTCGLKDEFDATENHYHPIKFENPSNYNRILRYKRSNEDNIIRGPFNANKHSSFVELVIVVDNKVYKTFNENMKKVHSHCKDIANIVNSLYVPLNIFVALVGVVIWNESNEIELTSDGDATLKNFLHYRRKTLVRAHPNDNAQLLTKEQFDGGVVGKALKGPICTFEYSGGVSMEHSAITSVVATTVAHEMGHNFGMEHDTSDCKCVDEKCIMSASSTSVVPTHWSSCSIDQLNVAFSHGMNYCLRNKPTKLFDSPHCGNGFVEVGEQCDCGLPMYCENTCCDPNTCMLHANASCATGECCDLSSCRPKTAGTECRSAEGECDLAEFCTGESEYCPTDVFRRDTEQCDNGNAFCYEGSCRSRSNQCKILWGPSGESSDHCYDKNVNGTRHGNCGYNRINNQYNKCEKEDVFCGMLHCRHLNERLEFGMESVAVLSHSFMNHKGTIIPCRSAIVDLGLQSTDPGLTPNGAKCGDGKMCVNQKCVAVDNLRAEGRGVSCPENCNNQGTCNSKGNCHCFEGFSYPLCDIPGPGGSVDSGPATNPNVRTGFTRAMYIFFLGVVPSISLFLFFLYYWKQNRPLSIRKSSNNSKLSIKSSPSRGANSPPGLHISTPSSTDDMNSALLKSPTDDTSRINNNMFGKFKGFTLKPLPSSTSATNMRRPNVALVHPVSKSPEAITNANGVPIRIAPPVPKPPMEILANNQPNAETKITQNGTLPNSGKMNNQNHINHQIPAPPALPPPNPGFHAKPIISSPVLEASTCTAKELISPLKNAASSGFPVRSAPTTPPVVTPQNNEIPTTHIIIPSSNGPVNKTKKDGTIKRIASFLKNVDKSDTIALQKPPAKVRPKIDRERLKTIEISAPIPVVDQSSDAELQDDKLIVNRSQSMRDPSALNKKVANAQVFGSMRQPSNTNRPKSIVGSRPKSPPPRPPALAINPLSSASSDYQNRLETNRFPSQQNEYDDCEAVEISMANVSDEDPTIGTDDNIYSVIDEQPAQKKAIPAPPAGCLAGSNDSMGLLGEIVNEIEKMNVDSIYSASTLKKKKPTDKKSSYLNDSKSNDYSNNDYINSNGSTTSSGYLKPLAINSPAGRLAPTKVEEPSPPPPPFSSFKPKSLTPSNVSTFKSSTNSTTATAREETKKQPTNQTVSSSIGTEMTKSQEKGKNPKQNSDADSKSNKSSLSSNLVPKLKTANSLKSTSSSSSSPSTTTNNNKLIGSAIAGKKNNDSLTMSSAKQKSSNLDKDSPASTTIQQTKPKPLVKPLVSSNQQSSSIHNNTGISDKRANLSNNVPKNLVSSNNRKIKTTTDGSSTPSTRKSSISNKFDGINDTSNNSTNSSSNNKYTTNRSDSKILSAAARPMPGKISNVASLQQKFETPAEPATTTISAAVKPTANNTNNSVNNKFTRSRKL